MNNNLKVYRSILKENDFKEYSYQKEFLTNGKFLSSKKPFVLAMGTSAGKTLTTLMFLEMFYRNNRNRNKKTIIIPSSVKILRDNFESVLSKFNTSFSYEVAKKSKELSNIIEEDNFDVLVCLPMSLKYQIKNLPKCDIFILDESHQWYFQSTITDILKRIKPKHQLLLCGTPSKFIANENKFNFQFVPIMELYEEKIITNAKIELVSTNYNTKNSDYVSTYGNLKLTKNFTKIQSRDALEYVCNQMLSKTKKRPKSKFDVFNFLPKTIIFCHSIQQSKDFYKILKSNINTKERVLMSNQKDDIDSINFNRFKSDKKIKVLICVNRGRLGFSMNQLFNVIDFTLTKNIDVMLQIYGRLLRTSKYKKGEKVYYKVSPNNDLYYFENIMNAMLCLTQFEWYTKFNGKNMDGIRIPLIRNPYQKVTTINKSSIKREIREFDRLKFGIPIDLNFFKKFKKINATSKFSSYSYTSLNEVQNVLTKKKLKPTFTLEELKVIAESYKSPHKFKMGNYEAYKYAVDIGVLEIICKNMKSLRTDWNYEKIKKIAEKYTSFSKFTKENPNAYASAMRFNYINELSSHMVKLNKKVDLNSVMNIAKKYKSRSEFHKGNQYSYSWAKKNNVLDEVTKHMVNYLKLNKIEALKMCRKYKSLNELKKIDNTLYNTVKRKKILSQLKFKK